ncbi:unnamed protein product [Pieris macdunnoughi]|uniref:Uncharacterized protein n=1 Tax=Pieris macdunnoughi TaxID=345717 RepID=A0A821U7D7_9NEOP|nr:unnamed protein product [Pieris macdunnoughi]
MQNRARGQFSSERAQRASERSSAENPDGVSGFHSLSTVVQGSEVSGVRHIIPVIYGVCHFHLVYQKTGKSSNVA